MKIEYYRLRSMPYAQCHVELSIDDSGLFKSVTLVSYSTKILTLNYTDEVWCTVNYPVDCSRTTARHVSSFTSEFLGRNLYHELKRTGPGFSKCYEGVFYTCMAQVQWYVNNGKHFHY